MHLKIIRDNLTKKAAKTLVASFGIIYATASVIDTFFIHIVLGILQISIRNMFAMKSIKL